MTHTPTRLVLAGLLLLQTAFGSAQLVAPAQAPGTWSIDMDWASLPEGQTWDGPTSWIEADGLGNIIVMVRTAPYFRVFNRDGSFVKAWGEDGFFRTAHSVTFDTRGFLWATDSTNHAVYKFSTDGELLQTLGTPGQAGDNASQTLFNEPNHVAVAPNGDLYVSDGYVNARIVHLSPDGDFIRIIGGLEGAEPGQLQVPHGIAVDSRGRMLVNDSDNQRISVFDADGRFLEIWPWPSRGGIVVTADDTVYVSDVNAGAVNIIRDGTLVDTITVEGRPHGLAVDSDGIIYVSDSLGRKVIRISRD